MGEKINFSIEGCELNYNQFMRTHITDLLWCLRNIIHNRIFIIIYLFHILNCYCKCFIWFLITFNDQIFWDNGVTLGVWYKISRYSSKPYSLWLFYTISTIMYYLLKKGNLFTLVNQIWSRFMFSAIKLANILSTLSA